MAGPRFGRTPDSLRPGTEGGEELAYQIGLWRSALGKHPEREADAAARVLALVLVAYGPDHIRTQEWLRRHEQALRGYLETACES